MAPDSQWDDIRGRRDFALLVGNGVNAYEQTQVNADDKSCRERGWKKMVAELWREHRPQDLPCADEKNSITLPELVDILCVSCTGNDRDIIQRLQEDVKKHLEPWKPGKAHENLIGVGVPILTTNYDNTFSHNLSTFGNTTSSKSFHPRYPWSVYHSEYEIQNVLTDRAVWHVHGMTRYRGSIQLTLSHYISSAARAKRFIEQGENSLFAGGALNWDAWRGSDSWMQVFLRKNLVIVGLELSTAEVFLRYMLIRRAKIAAASSGQHDLTGWYIQDECEGIMPEGKRKFLEAVGIKVVSGVSRSQIYEQSW